MLHKNGAQLAGFTAVAQPASGHPFAGTVHVGVVGAVNDFFELVVYQSTGVAVNTYAASMWAVRQG
jgi:hypothetical protein